MSVRAYLISKANREYGFMEDARRQRKVQNRDPAFLGTTAAALGGSGAAGYGLYRHSGKMIDAETAARRKGQGAVKAAYTGFMAMPKRYQGALAVGTGGAVAQSVRSQQLRRRRYAAEND